MIPFLRFMIIGLLLIIEACNSRIGTPEQPNHVIIKTPQALEPSPFPKASLTPSKTQETTSFGLLPTPVPLEAENNLNRNSTQPLPVSSAPMQVLPTPVPSEAENNLNRNSTQPLPVSSASMQVLPTRSQLQKAIVKGHVTHWSSPVRNQRIELISKESINQTDTDDNGFFQFENVPVSIELEIRVVHPLYVFYSSRFTLENTKELRKDITLTPSEVACDTCNEAGFYTFLHGKIHDTQGQLIEGAEITIVSQSSARPYIASIKSPKGYYQFNHVPTGVFIEITAKKIGYIGQIKKKILEFYQLPPDYTRLPEGLNQVDFIMAVDMSAS